MKGDNTWTYILLFLWGMIVFTGAILGLVNMQQSTASTNQTANYNTTTNISEITVNTSTNSSNITQYSIYVINTANQTLICFNEQQYLQMASELQQIKNQLNSIQTQEDINSLANIFLGLAVVSQALGGSGES